MPFPTALVWSEHNRLGQNLNSTFCFDLLRVQINVHFNYPKNHELKYFLRLKRLQRNYKLNENEILK